MCKFRKLSFAKHTVLRLHLTCAGVSALTRMALSDRLGREHEISVIERVVEIVHLAVHLVSPFSACLYKDVEKRNPQGKKKKNHNRKGKTLKLKKVN